MKPRITLYVLNEDDVPIPATVEEWAAWMLTNSARRILRKDRVGDCEVSTVFLCIDHSFNPLGPPILFETMIFSDDTGWDNDYQERYSTRALALEGHQRAIAWCKANERSLN